MLYCESLALGTFCKHCLLILSYESEARQSGWIQSLNMCHMTKFLITKAGETPAYSLPLTPVTRHNARSGQLVYGVWIDMHLCPIDFFDGFGSDHLLQRSLRMDAFVFEHN